MIPVILQPEPANFNTDVRQRGHMWLAANKIALSSAPKNASGLPNYWAATNKQLWEAYSGTCAYLSIYFEFCTGASSTDHFIAKSKKAGDAYEWSNFRLACLGANRNKNKFDDILDPIGLNQNTFFLNLASGYMKPNPSISPRDLQLAKSTIKRLNLNGEDLKRMRVKHFNQYLRHKHSEILKELNPFVWYEANRQGLL